MQPKHQCVKRIHTREGLASFTRQCRRTKTTLEDGDYCCFQHRPSRVAADVLRHRAALEARLEAVRKEPEAQGELERHAACYDELLVALQAAEPYLKEKYGVDTDVCDQVRSALARHKGRASA